MKKEPVKVIDIGDTLLGFVSQRTSKSSFRCLTAALKDFVVPVFVP